MVAPVDRFVAEKFSLSRKRGMGCGTDEPTGDERFHSPPTLCRAFS